MNQTQTFLRQTKAWLAQVKPNLRSNQLKSNPINKHINTKKKKRQLSYEIKRKKLASPRFLISNNDPNVTAIETYPKFHVS